MKEKKPTPAQRRLMAAIGNGGVMRHRYAAHYPGGVTFTWHWVGLHGAKFTERTVRACESRGWVKSIRGELKPGAEGFSGYEIAIRDLRHPDRLELTTQLPGRATL